MESNNSFEDLYDVLEVHMGSTKKEIIEQYKNKIESYSNKIREGVRLGEEELWEVKLLKISKYVLTNPELREKYNVSRIINSTEEDEQSQHSQNNDSNIQNTNPHNKYLDYDNGNVSSRKDNSLNLDQLSNRQFERFDHQNFDLTKDRMLRSSKNI